MVHVHARSGSRLRERSSARSAHAPPRRPRSSGPRAPPPSWLSARSSEVSVGAAAAAAAAAASSGAPTSSRVSSAFSASRILRLSSLRSISPEPSASNSAKSCAAVSGSNLKPRVLRALTNSGFDTMPSPSLSHPRSKSMTRIQCCARCAWDGHGVCMGCAWDVMACAWCVRGVCSVCAWCVHATHICHLLELCAQACPKRAHVGL